MPILVAIMGVSTGREESQSLTWLQIPVLGNSRVRLDLSCTSSKQIFKMQKVDKLGLDNFLGSKAS